MNEIKCGRIGANTLNDCADRAAQVIADFSKPRAVCLAPDGQVTVEAPTQVIPDDLVGVYAPKTAPLALLRLIHDDLCEAQAERGITGGRNQRHRVEKFQRDGKKREGRPCGKCGGTLRYVTSSACVSCTSKSSRQRQLAKKDAA
jgi:hypothetical protein